MTLTVKELREKAEELNLNHKGLRKQELESLLESHNMNASKKRNIRSPRMTKSPPRKETIKKSPSQPRKSPKTPDLLDKHDKSDKSIQVTENKSPASVTRRKSPGSSPRRKTPVVTKDQEKTPPYVAKDGEEIKYNVKELKNMAKEQGIKGYSDWNKKKLCEALGLICSTEFQPRKIYRYSKSQLMAMGNERDISLRSKMSVPEMCELLQINCEIEKLSITKNTREIKYKILKKRQSRLNRGRSFLKKNMIKRKKGASHPLRNKILSHVKPKNEKKGSKYIRKLKLSKYQRDEEERLKKDCIHRSRVPLKPHQIDLVQSVFKIKKGTLGAHEVGSGKTLAGWAACECFLDQNEKNRVIFICPVALKKNFETTGIEEYGSRYRFHLVPEEDDDMVDIDGELHPKIMIMGKDEFRIYYKHVDHDNLYHHFKNTMVIIDEAHSLRGTEGKIKKLFKIVKRCCKYASKVLLLTGTPVYNDLYDIANLISLIKGESPIYKDEFEELIDENGEIIDNEDSRKYFDCSISIFKAGNTDDYPQKNEHYISIPMTDEIYYSYRKIECQIGKKKPNNPNGPSGSKNFFSGLRTGLPEISPLKNPKYLKMKEILIDQYKKGEKDEKGSGKRVTKSIIFSEFKGKGINNVRKVLNNRSMFHIEKFTGDTTAEERNELVERFNRNEFNILLVTKAGGEGLDLKGVRNVFILEGQWNHSVIDQVVARGLRYMSHSKLKEEERLISVYYMMFTKPSEEKRKEILDRMMENDPYYLSLSPEHKEAFMQCKEMNQSADEVMFDNSRLKMKLRDNFIASLEKFSIEQC